MKFTGETFQGVLVVLISIYVWRTTGLSLPLLSPVISVLSLFASLARFPSPSSPNSFSVLPSDGRVFRRFSRNTLLCLYWPKFYKAQIFFFSFFQTNLNSVFINFFFPVLFIVCTAKRLIYILTNYVQ